MSLIIHKFGGAALADGDAIVGAARIVAAHRGRRVAQVVVASALAGVTDTLLEVAERAASGDVAAAVDAAERLLQRHRAVADRLRATIAAPTHAAALAIDEAEAAAADSLAELARVAEGLAALQELSPTVMDTIVARGERLSARFVVAALRAAGVEAEYVDAAELLVTDGQPGNAFPDLARSAPVASALLLPLLRGGVTPVVPGFIGAPAKDAPPGGPSRPLIRGGAHVVTLGRGGSDLTATSLGRALGADAVMLWKDVPGLLTGDPRVVENARVIPAMLPAEASELAYHGAKVLHPRALIPLTATIDGVPAAQARLVIRAFAEPDVPGTVIEMPAANGAARAKRAPARHPVRAVSAMRDQAIVTIRGTGMAGVPGIAARAFSALERVHVSVSLISQASSEQSISIGIASSAVPLAVPVLRDAFARELARGEVEAVQVQAGVATVAVIGNGMAGVPGIAARVFGALADARINILSIAQGSSELSISVVVEDAEAAAAQRAIHAAFRLDRIGGGAAHAPAHADVVILGLGKVGRELARQLAAVRRGATAHGTPVEVVGVIDSSGFVFAPEGLSPRRIAAISRAKDEGQPLASISGGRAGAPASALREITRHALSRPILVDVTAGDTSHLLAEAVRHGMDLVLANKRPIAEARPAGDGDADDVLGAAAAAGRRVLHEATVGAGLPIIDTIHKLLESGDPILRIEASPSGTLGFLFAELGRGRTFSDALADAAARGYTEPDPRDDLSGLDVARKAVILARLVGWRGTLDDVAIESLVPEPLREVSREEFLARTAELDAPWAERVAAARSRGCVLRYKANVTAKHVTVSVEEVEMGSSFAALTGTDNQFVFTTRRYRDRPLVITGPGAGPAVTAAGVLNDILSLAGAR